MSPLPPDHEAREALELGRAALNGHGDNGAPFELPVLTAAELCALPDRPRSGEILGPLLVRGYRLVVGAGTGEGKTTLALAMVRAVAVGGELLGWRAEQGRALIIDAEQGLRTAKRRLAEAGVADSDAIDYVRVPDGLALNRDAGQIAAVEAQLAEGGYSVVLCDPLYKLHDGQSNDEREAVDLMRRFDGWRERFAFAFVVPVHTRKRPVGKNFSMDEFHGSTAYTRGAETVLGLQRIRDGYSKLWWFKDRDGDLPATGSSWGLLFDREQGFRRDPNDDKPRETAAEQIRGLLEAQPGLTERQLIDATGKAEKTVRQALKELGAEFVKIGSHGQKQWKLAGRDDTPPDLDWGG